MTSFLTAYVPAYVAIVGAIAGLVLGVLLGARGSRVRQANAEAERRAEERLAAARWYAAREAHRPQTAASNGDACEHSLPVLNFRPGKLS